MVAGNPQRAIEKAANYEPSLPSVNDNI